MTDNTTDFEQLRGQVEDLEHRLRRRAEILQVQRLQLESGDHAVLLLDEAQRIQHADGRLEALAGIGATQLQGRPVADVVAAAAGPLDRTGAWEGRVDLRRSDGTVSTVDARCTALTRDDGSLGGTLLLLRPSGGGASTEVQEAVADRDRLLAAYQTIGEAILSSLDPEQVLDILPQQIVAAGILRSLLVGLVEPDENRVRVVRAFSSFVHANFVPGLARRIDTLDSDSVFALDGPNVIAETARTGRMQVIDGWDPVRFGKDRPPRPSDLHKVSYFLPVKKGDQVLAVLATASTPEMKPVVLQRIEAMQPLLNLMAIAMEHARLYQSLSEAREQLIRTERMRAASELSAGISHNLNNLLGGILMPAEMLLMQDLPESVRRHAESIYEAGERARQLVQRLSEAVGPARRGPAAADVSAAVREAVNLSRPRWQDARRTRGIDIRVDTALQPVPPVACSDSDLAGVVLNLLLNAIEALPGGGGIEIATSRQDDGLVELRVRDGGTGMDEETRLHAFEPFATTKPTVGAGLGLATVHGIVTRAGGHIEIDSQPGRGTTVTVQLPPADGETPADRAPLAMGRDRPSPSAPSSSRTTRRSARSWRRR